MIAVDTSVAVAAFGGWHRLHEPARSAIDDGVALPAHALLETYAVLTGFPPPHRAPVPVAHRWLTDRFDVVLPAPPVSEHQRLVATLARHGRTGGAVYDALVGLTAQTAGATLVTADDRAAAIYELLRVSVRPLAS